MAGLMKVSEPRPVVPATLSCVVRSEKVWILESLQTVSSLVMSDICPIQLNFALSYCDSRATGILPKDNRGQRNPKHGAVARRERIEIVRRDDPAGSRPIFRDDRRLPRYVPAEMFGEQ